MMRITVTESGITRMGVSIIFLLCNKKLKHNQFILVKEARNKDEDF